MGRIPRDILGLHPRFIGTVGLFLTGILVAIRFLPVISLHEMRALVQRHAAGGAA